MSIFPDNDYRNYLEHHGVKGQKHGVRNAEWYPIADWKAHLARTGQTHGNNSGGKKIKYKKLPIASTDASDRKLSKAAIDNDAVEYRTPKEKIQAVVAGCMDEPTSKWNDYVRGDAYIRDRFNKAADLGTEALKEQPYFDKQWMDEMDKDSLRAWFLFEDQTIGMPMVADMINNGYTADQVEKMIKIVHRELDNLNDDDWRKLYYTNGVFESQEGNWNDSLVKFARNCEKVKNESQNEKIQEKSQNEKKFLKTS